MFIQKLKSDDAVTAFLVKEGCAVLLHHQKSVKASLQAKNFLVEFARDYPLFQVVIAKIEHAPEYAQRHGVVSVPTTIFFKDGKELARFEGYKPIEIREKAIQITRLADLVKQSKLMLFMKGTPEDPFCGFSRQIIGLLNGINADYGSFNILADKEVREGLKTFSNWQTYPQLYLDGQLLGGVDVVEEEIKDLNFVATIPRKSNV